MIDKDEWRLQINDVEYLKNKCINPTDGAEITEHMPYHKKCVFCWDKVENTHHQWWFMPEDMSCCICEECYNDFKEMFEWKALDGWDIDWTLRCPKCRTELTLVSNQDYLYKCEKCKVLYSQDFEDEVELGD